MRNALINIIKKELKEIIRDPRLFLTMILLPILIMPIMGIAFQGLISQAGEGVKGGIKIAVINLDEGNVSEAIINSPKFNIILDNLNISMILLNDLGINSISDAIDYLVNNGSIKALVVFPENFTYCVSNQLVITISVYYFIERSNPSSIIAITSKVFTFVQLLKQEISTYVILNIDPNANPIFIRDPISLEFNSVYEGKVIRAPPSLIMQTFFMQALMMPIAVMMLLSIAIQFAATSVASEKEQKTLEILLTMPIDRETILFGKLTGSILIAILGTIGYAIGFQFYIQSVTSPIGGEEVQIKLSEIGLSIDPLGFALIATSLFLSLLAILALVMILASFAEDVRTAQSLTGIILFPVMLVGFLAIFAMTLGVPTVWMQIMLFIPFTSPMITPIYIISKQYLIVIISLIAILIETIIAIKIAAKFYSSEIILSAKLKLRRRK